MMSGVLKRIHHQIGDPDHRGSLSARLRSRRFDELLRRFPDLPDLRVLDLGGHPDFWAKAPVHPAEVVTVNLDPATATDPRVRHIVADACDVAMLKTYGGGFELVVSNSLIEHVGGPLPRQAFAEVVAAAAPWHWIQTPDRYFPVEPHWLAPGFQFLPLRAQAELIRRWPLAHQRVRSYADAVEQARMIELLSVAELRFLFPESELWKERVLGFAKSIVVVKAPVR